MGLSTALQICILSPWVWFCGKNPAVVAAAEKMAGKSLDPSLLTWKGFFIHNLVPVTLGNIVGGVILIGIVFWFIYLRPHSGDLSPEGKTRLSQGQINF